MEIFGRELGKECFIIAEAGSNHNGDVKIGKKLIEAAKQAGADAVKFQAFKTEELVIKNAPKAGYMKKGKEKDLFELLKKLELGENQHKELFDYAQKVGIPIFWSVFDRKSADMIEGIGAEIFKTGSGELTDIPLLKYLAEKGKPMIISTGMSDLEEVRNAVEAVGKNIALLHCTTGYPCKIEDVNLRAMKTLAEEFNVPVGYSDHTLGIEVSLAAVMEGACMIERHLTLDKEMEGPDHKMSLNTREFSRLVEGVREIENGKKVTIKDFEIILGSEKKQPSKNELEERVWARKSVVARTNIKKGETIAEKMLAVKRPGTGLSPNKYWSLIGKTAIKAIEKDEQIKFNLIK